MPFHRKLLLLLASIRFANLPSVVSNVWLGVALGVVFFDPKLPAHLWLAASLLALAGLTLYVSGNFLNDWHDRHWDARHRPERALPQGAFSHQLYLGLAILCATVGVALAGFVGLPSGMVAALIVLCIVGYTRWHKTAEWPVLLMGLCRGLLPALYFLTCFWPNRPPMPGSEPHASSDWLVALWILMGAASACLGLTLYVVALSKAARRESAPATSDPIIYPLFLFIIAGFALTVVPLRGEFRYAFSGLLLFSVWLRACLTKFRQPISARVSALLAGLPLLDWVALLPIGLWMLESHSPEIGHRSVALVSLLLPPLAFITGRLLQRLTPAT